MKLARLGLPEPSGTAPNEGNPDHTFVEPAALVQKAVVSQHITMVRRENNNGIFNLIRILEVTQQFPDSVVDLGDQGVVVGFDHAGVGSPLEVAGSLAGSHADFQVGWMA